MNWYYYESDKVERIGSYPACLIMDDIYEIEEIPEMEEKDIEDVKKWAIENNEDVLCIRNLDDKTKCKEIISFSDTDFITKETADKMPELFLYIQGYDKTKDKNERKIHSFKK